MSSRSIGDAFDWWARREPDGVAVRAGADVLTRAELDERADAVARGWIAEGLRLDDGVTLALPCGVDLVVGCVAVWKAGATPQPLSPEQPAPERAATLDLVRPWRVVTEVPTGDAIGLPPLEPGLTASSWKLSTSGGSTGVPKVVGAAAPATVDPEAAVAPFLPRRAVQLVAVPLWHAASFTYAMRGLMSGHELVLLEPFDSGAWLRAVERHRVSWGLLGPPMMRAILDHPDRSGADVSSLESVLHLGAPCPEGVKRGWLDWLGPDRVVEVYAGTEAQGLTMATGREWLARPGTVGRPIGGSRFRVVRPDGTDCRPGEIGEVLMRRGRQTYRYLGAVPDVRDGWHTQGDLGWLDGGGWLFLAGRVADVIARGAVRIDPAEIEQLLEAHTAVHSALVVGRHDRGQHRLHAVVETTDLSAVIAYAATLPEQLRPDSWQAVGVPLRTVTGKVRRRDWG